LLALSDDATERLADDAHGLIDLLAVWRPGLGALHELIDLPRSALPEFKPPARLMSGVPGRKQAQIAAFAGALGEVSHPILEWCSGKGHLGRLVAWMHPVPVTSFEIDPDLVHSGQALSYRRGLAQMFLQGDALLPESAAYLEGRHALALHACGELHLALLRGATEQRSPALDLVPCCYYRIPHSEYRPLNPDASVVLSRDELHLAVTESVTLGARERRLRDEARARKLAFVEWRSNQGVPRSRPFNPVPSAWLSLEFGDWITRLASREGVPSPPGDRWQDLEREGWRRLHDANRLELMRLAFRRPLEVWLALDRALYLERRGYRVKLSEFCERNLTPRNLLISAKLEVGSL
jgi:hypothetical protein